MVIILLLYVDRSEKDSLFCPIYSNKECFLPPSKASEYTSTMSLLFRGFTVLCNALP